jgi:hypothetical protein
MLNIALPPVHLVNEAGWELIAIAWFTARTALFDVTGEHGASPLTTTLYEPASATATPFRVNVDVVAPEIFPVFVKLINPFLH